MPAFLGLAVLVVIAVAAAVSGRAADEPAVRNTKGSAAAPVVVEEWGDFG